MDKIDETEENTRKSEKWIFLYILGVLLDILLVVFVAIKGWNIIFYIIIVLIICGVILLNTLWNKDERTDTAIKNAARNSINIYSAMAVTTGLILLLVKWDYSWVIGTTLILSAVLLMYINLVLAYYYEREMS